MNSKTQKLNSLVFIAIVLVITACNPGKNNNSNVVMTQEVRNDSVTTIFSGVQPYQLNKRIETRVSFTRAMNETEGRFFLHEVYLNRKDSVLQQYDGVGSYKMLPDANGERKGVALYDMVMDDKSKGYMYLLKDSLTLVKVDGQGNELKGNDATVLKYSASK